MPELSEVEVALAKDIRAAAVDDLNRFSDRSIVDISWMICDSFDYGMTAGDVEAGLEQSRFNEAMIAAFVGPSVTALCPEHGSKLDDGDI